MCVWHVPSQFWQDITDAVLNQKPHLKTPLFYLWTFFVVPTSPRSNFFHVQHNSIPKASIVIRIGVTVYMVCATTCIHLKNTLSMTYIMAQTGRHTGIDHTHTHTHTHMHACAHMHTHKHAHIHTHKHAHIHTHTQLSPYQCHCDLKFHPRSSKLI